MHISKRQYDYSMPNVCKEELTDINQNELLGTSNISCKEKLKNHPNDLLNPRSLIERPKSSTQTGDRIEEGQMVAKSVTTLPPLKASRVRRPSLPNNIWKTMEDYSPKDQNVIQGKDDLAQYVQDDSLFPNHLCRLRKISCPERPPVCLDLKQKGNSTDCQVDLAKPDVVQSEKVVRPSTRTRKISCPPIRITASASNLIPAIRPEQQSMPFDDNSISSSHEVKPKAQSQMTHGHVIKYRERPKSSCLFDCNPTDSHDRDASNNNSALCLPFLPCEEQNSIKRPARRTVSSPPAPSSSALNTSPRGHDTLIDNQNKSNEQEAIESRRVTKSARVRKLSCPGNMSRGYSAQTSTPERRSLLLEDHLRRSSQEYDETMSKAMQLFSWLSEQNIASSEEIE